MYLLQLDVIGLCRTYFHTLNLLRKDEITWGGEMEI